MIRNKIPVAIILGLVVMTVVVLAPNFAFASVESSLHNIQDKLINTILPLLAIIGLGLAGGSFALGSPNAKQHLLCAILGCIVGFGAQSIVNLIQSLVH